MNFLLDSRAQNLQLINTLSNQKFLNSKSPYTTLQSMILVEISNIYKSIFAKLQESTYHKNKLFLSLFIISFQGIFQSILAQGTLKQILMSDFSCKLILYQFGIIKEFSKNSTLTQPIQQVQVKMNKLLFSKTHMGKIQAEKINHQTTQTTSTQLIYITYNQQQGKMKEYEKCLEHCNCRRFQLAIEGTTRLIKNSEGLKSESYNLRGYCLHYLERYEEAVADFTEAIRLKSNFSNAYFNRGITYSRLQTHEDIDAAISDFTKVIQIKKENSNSAYVKRGNLYLKRKKLRQAIADYNKAIELNPQNAEAYEQRGNTYNLKGEPKQAIKNFTQAITLNPQNYNLRYNRGNSYKIMKLYKQAANDLSIYIRKVPNLPEAYIHRGSAYKMLQLNKKAIYDFTKAILLSPYDCNAYNNRGTALAALAQQMQSQPLRHQFYQKALMDYNRALKVKSQHTKSYYNRANLKKKWVKYDQALEDYDQAIYLQPTKEKYFRMKGNVYFQMKKYQKAIQEYAEAVRLSPKNPKVYNCRAEAYLNLGKYQQAQDNFLQAREISPNNPLYMFNLANYYSLIKKSADAQFYFKQGSDRLNKIDDVQLQADYQLSRENIAYLRNEIQKYNQKKENIEGLQKIAEQVKEIKDFSNELNKITQKNFLITLQKTSYVQKETAELGNADQITKNKNQNKAQQNQTKNQFISLQNQINKLNELYFQIKAQFSQFRQAISILKQKYFVVENLFNKIYGLKEAQLSYYYRYLFSVVCNHFLAYRVSSAGFFQQQTRSFKVVSKIIDMFCQTINLASIVPFGEFLSYPLNIISAYRKMQTADLNNEIARKINGSILSAQPLLVEYMAAAIGNLMDNPEFNKNLLEAIHKKEQSYIKHFIDMLAQLPDKIKNKIFGKKEGQFKYVDKVITCHTSLLTLRLYQMEEGQFITASRDKLEFYKLILGAISSEFATDEDHIAAKTQSEEGSKGCLDCCFSSAKANRNSKY